MANCDQKRHHKTEREALNHLAWARKQPGGHKVRTLNVYECPCGQGWCVGRAWRGKRQREVAEPKPKPAPKALTPGQQRRKAKRQAEFDARQAFYADWHDTLMHAKRMADAEIRRMERALDTRAFPP